MKHAVLFAPSLVFLLTAPLLAACGTSSPEIVDPSGQGDDAAASGGHDQDAGEAGAEDNTPHALGTIVLGEVHAAGQSESQPLVSVSFVPDAAKIVKCSETVGGCEVLALPKCSKTKSSTGCASDEMCTWSDGCQATCKPIPYCETACEDDDVCVVDPASSAHKGICQKQPGFDAGPIAFSGTTSSLTLFPPYAYRADASGAPFLGGSEIHVQAQGAAEAGFEGFDESFTATTFIQTKPSISKLRREEVFGTGPVKLGWVPGKDAVVVTASGPAGTARCKANDASGAFDVPRAVVERVLGTEPGFTPVLSLSVARERRETKKGHKTKGTLPNVKVEPVGWLDLVTSSSESTSLQGCSGDTLACGDSCVDVKTDPDNCGACGVTCSGATSGCVSGKCAAVCVQGPEDTLAACTDGCSNDGDPYIDCNDYDCCPVLTNCPSTTSCGKQ